MRKLLAKFKINLFLFGYVKLLYGICNVKFN